MIGFVDESIRAGANGIYVIAAAIIAPTDSEHIRRDVRALLRGRQQRFHWRDESEAMRQRMLDHLTRLDLDAVISVQEPVEPAKLERARALCLQRLLWELLDTDLEELVIESRQDHNDRRDRRTIAHAQRSKTAPPGLAYRFAWPHDEPLLWIADALASATGASLATSGTGYLERLQQPGGRIQIKVVRA